MLKSMTGFGRHEITTDDYKFVVEMKAVNHRYCDISVKIPKSLSFFEAGIRSLIKKHISRGKIDVYISYEDFTENKVNVKYNREIANEYYDKLHQISSDLMLETDLTAYRLSRYPEVLTLEAQTNDETVLWDILEKTLLGTIEKFVESRIAEGGHLKEDLFAKLDEMFQYVEFIEARTPQIVAEYREKLTAKVHELLGDTKIDESVLATEIIIYADKICVDEETVRLKSHIKNTKATLEEGINIGRKLDFIAQEMNREANTILSKASDLEISNIAINLKTEIEKLREQIQNIE